MSVGREGLRQRPTAAATSSDSDMAYGGTNRNRPVLATAITRSVSGGLHNSNRVLRRYLNRILLVLTVTAVYTAFIYKSGGLTVAMIRPNCCASLGVM